MPEKLPGREQEKKHIQKYLERAIKHGGKERPLYIAGLPGTGKTATVTQVVKELRKQSDRGTLPDFKVRRSSGFHGCAQPHLIAAR